jgi:hypothetical protein
LLYLLQKLRKTRCSCKGLLLLLLLHMLRCSADSMAGRCCGMSPVTAICLGLLGLGSMCCVMQSALLLLLLSPLQVAT